MASAVRVGLAVHGVQDDSCVVLGSRAGEEERGGVVSITAPASKALVSFNVDAILQVDKPDAVFASEIKGKLKESVDEGTDFAVVLLDDEVDPLQSVFDFTIRQSLQELTEAGTGSSIRMTALSFRDHEVFDMLGDPGKPRLLDGGAQDFTRVEVASHEEALARYDEVCAGEERLSAKKVHSVVTVTVQRESEGEEKFSAFAFARVAAARKGQEDDRRALDEHLLGLQKPKPDSKGEPNRQKPSFLARAMKRVFGADKREGAPAEPLLLPLLHDILEDGNFFALLSLNAGAQFYDSALATLKLADSLMGLKADSAAGDTAPVHEQLGEGGEEGGAENGNLLHLVENLQGGGGDQGAGEAGEHGGGGEQGEGEGEAGQQGGGGGGGRGEGDAPPAQQQLAQELVEAVEEAGRPQSSSSSSSEGAPGFADNLGEVGNALLHNILGSAAASGDVQSALEQQLERNKQAIEQLTHELAGSKRRRDELSARLEQQSKMHETEVQSLYKGHSVALESLALAHIETLARIRKELGFEAAQPAVRSWAAAQVQSQPPYDQQPPRHSHNRPRDEISSSGSRARQLPDTKPLALSFQRE